MRRNQHLGSRKVWYSEHSLLVPKSLITIIRMLSRARVGRSPVREGETDPVLLTERTTRRAPESSRLAGDITNLQRPPLNSTDASIRRRAILIVLASFVLTFTGCGLNFAFGVYQEFYETEDGPFGPGSKVSPAKIDLIGTLAVSLMTIGAPFASAWTRAYSPRTVTLIGGFILASANVLASFCAELWQFILTQGVLLGCGTCLTYIPAVTVAPQWFDHRRGLAMGVILSGTGVGGVVWAPLLRYMNSTIGFRNALRVTGAIAFVLISFSALVLRWEATAEHARRLENEARAARHGRAFNLPLVNWSIVKSRTFAAQATGAILQAAAYYTPIYFFSSYARTLGYSATSGANFIALSNASSALGKVLLGSLADRYGRLNALCACTVISAASTLALWLPSTLGTNVMTDKVLFLAFSSIYGVFAGAYVSLFPTALAESFGVQNFASVNGLLYMIRGFGTLIGTPVAGSLIHRQVGRHMSSSFEKTSLMVGCLLLGASVAVSWARVEASIKRGGRWTWRM
jgi:MFS family permease